jgi:enoyl-CoA hydratase
MSYETLVVERDGPVGWITFNRPDVGNAMNAAMFDELARVWIELDDDPAVRTIVLTGGGKAFNTGLDVVSLARDPDSLRKIRRQMREYDMHFTARHQRVAKPVIAAVNGVCAGGGLQFVTDSDLAVCSSKASFLDPHVSIGQTVGYSAFTLARTIPFGAAMRLALVGRHERMSAERALQVGLVGEIVDPPSRLRDVAQELGEAIAKNSPTAVALSKRSMWRTLQMGLDDACRAGSVDIVEMWSHPDQEEGPAAFAAKREPRWQPPAARPST